MSATVISLANTFQVNDWFLSVMILTLLLMLVVMGPYGNSFIDGFSSMLRFKNPDGDVSFPLLSTVGYASAFILSCLSVGMAATIFLQDVTKDGTEPLLFLSGFSVVVLMALVVKLLLYTTVNKILYKSQTIRLKPARWNCFFVMTVSIAGFSVLVFSAVVLFLGLPVVLLLVFGCLMRILVISGRIFKIKTTLFKDKRSNLGFIVYLCAFEIVPVLIELVFSGRYLGLI